MKVQLLMIAQIEVEASADPLAAAQAKLDAFREAALPSDWGITLYTTRPDQLEYPKLLSGLGGARPLTAGLRWS